MRTDKEILDRINIIEPYDFLGAERNDLLVFLTFEAAKPYLKPEVTPDQWTSTDQSELHIKQMMLDYMPFAWGKANNCRGLSAGRSINHMCAWLWMLGEDAAADAIRNYSHYGKPQLRAICEAYGWEWQQWDDGAWTNNESEPDSPSPETVQPLPMKAGRHN